MTLNHDKLLSINGVKAVIIDDSDIDLFRGEFIGLNGGADFYAKDSEGLRREGAISLKVFLDACQEDGVESFKFIPVCYIASFPR